MGIVIMGAVFVDIKGYPDGNYIPAGRNAGRAVERANREAPPLQLAHQVGGIGGS